MTKEELVQRVWPFTFVEEANLAYFMGGDVREVQVNLIVLARPAVRR